MDSRLEAQEYYYYLTASSLADAFEEWCQVHIV